MLAHVTFVHVTDSKTVFCVTQLQNNITNTWSRSFKANMSLTGHGIILW